MPATLTKEEKELLEDARLVASYGIRSGRLSDATLSNAIALVESNAQADLPLPASIGALIAAFASSVKQIAPITLIDLRGHRDPLDPHQRSRIVIKQGIFSVLCIAITLCVATMSLVQYQKTTALNFVVATDAARPREQYLKVWNLYRSSNPKMDQAIATVIQQQTDSLRDIDNRLFTAVSIIFPAIRSGNWLFRFTGLVGTTSQEPENKAIIPRNDQTLPNVQDWSASCDGAKAQNCQSQVKGILFQSLDPANSLTEEFTFFTLQRLNYTSVSTPNFATEEILLSAEISLINNWITPFLYGLLGACVFCTRSFMDVTTANMRFWSALSRVFMGGVAGIVMGWLWVSVPVKETDLSTLSSPAVIAFIAGFGIEVLFTLLDNINKSILRLISTSFGNS